MITDNVGQISELRNYGNEKEEIQQVGHSADRHGDSGMDSRGAVERPARADARGTVRACDSP